MRLNSLSLDSSWSQAATYQALRKNIAASF
jgi:hypothetical protein